MKNKEKLFIELDGLKVQVAIADERTIFGRKEYEVVPTAGAGSKWIRIESLLKVDPNLKDKIVIH